MKVALFAISFGSQSCRQEPGVDDWEEAWIRPHCIEEDLKKFEEAERKTQARLQVAFLDQKVIDQLKKDREMIKEGFAFLKEYRDNTIEGLCEEMEAQGGSTYTRKMRQLQDKRSEDQVLHPRRKRGRINGGVDSQSRRRGRGVALSLSRMQWTRANEQLLPSVLGADQERGCARSASSMRRKAKRTGPIHPCSRTETTQDERHGGSQLTYCMVSLLK